MFEVSSSTKGKMSQYVADHKDRMETSTSSAACAHCLGQCQTQKLIATADSAVSVVARRTPLN